MESVQAVRQFALNYHIQIPARMPLIISMALLYLGSSLYVSAREEGKLNLPRKLDGKIAFCALDNGFWQIWVVDCSNGNCQALTTSPIDKRTPTWDKAGSSITYRTSNGQIEVLDVVQGASKPIAPALGFLIDPRVSPLGDKIVFARFQPEPPDNTDLFVYAFATKNLIRITDAPTLEYAPAWSADGKHIAYVSGHGMKGHFLWMMDADGANKRKLQDIASDDMTPAWSPNGEWIAFSSSRSGDYEVWRVKADGSRIEQLTNSPGLDTAPCYSPDGLNMLITSNRGGRLQLWVMKPDGSDCQTLTPPTMDARDPAWWHAPTEGESKSVLGAHTETKP